MALQKKADSGLDDWDAHKLPDLSGKTYLITGGNSGIGFEAAKYLGVAGGNIIIASRNPEKGEAAVVQLRPEVTGSVNVITLDLADLSSVKKAAAQTRTLTKKLDALINNAGIMQTPEQKTVDGFEMQLGTNHLGHFLLNGLLFDLVENASGRIVTVSSIAHKYGQMYLDDLMMTETYTPTQAYGQSKLANMLYGLELHKRLNVNNSPVTSFTCHPGYSATALQSTGPTGLWNGLYKVTNKLMAQSPQRGALPTVLCAAGTEAIAGAHYGPTGFGETRGPIGDALVSDKARREEDALDLWQQSEKLVDFAWDNILPHGES